MVAVFRLKVDVVNYAAIAFEQQAWRDYVDFRNREGHEFGPKNLIERPAGRPEGRIEPRAQNADFLFGFNGDCCVSTRVYDALSHANQNEIYEFIPCEILGCDEQRWLLLFTELRDFLIGHDLAKLRTAQLNELPVPSSMIESLDVARDLRMRNRIFCADQSRRETGFYWRYMDGGWTGLEFRKLNVDYHR